jgi:hypothetical protein
MSDPWRPSKIEHDILTLVKERQAKEKRGLHETEIVRFVSRTYPDLYSKTEINDAIVVLAGKKFLKKDTEIQRIPAMRNRHTNKVDVPARSHKLELYTVSDKGILYLREMNGEAPEGPGIQLYNSSEPYSVRRLFEGLFSGASKDIKIIDNYLGKKTLDYLMAAKGRNVPIKIMTSSSKEGGFDSALADFISEYDAKVDIQEKPGSFHGRVTIVDGQAYILDHSIKDFGSKPSSITKVEEPVINSKYLELFEENWTE